MLDSPMFPLWSILLGWSVGGGSPVRVTLTMSGRLMALGHGAASLKMLMVRLP